MVKLAYWDSITLNTLLSADNYIEYTFAINGLHDPDITGTGHQPRGWDQWKNFYGYYLVRGCKYDITFRFSGIDSGADAAVSGMAGIHVGGYNEATLFDTIDDFMERPLDPHEKRKHWSAGSSTAREVATIYGKTNFKGFIKCKQIQQLYQRDSIWPQNFITVNNTNPSSPFRQDLVLWAASLPTGTGTSSGVETNNLPTTFVEVLLTYYVELSDPQELAPS